MFHSVSLLFIIITINIIRRLIIMTFSYLDVSCMYTHTKGIGVPDLMMCK